MKPLAVPRSPSAVEPPLSIGAILERGVANAPEQEIVHGTRSRYSYAELARRVARLASALSALGVKPGSTVAMMDWDTPRYLEAFFAVPMMGAVLHTVNVRLSPEQILYTINHAQDEVVLVNPEFQPIVDAIRPQVREGVTFVAAGDEQYDAMLAAANPHYEWPELPEDTRATTFYTTGTTGLPKAVYYSHRQLVLHTLAVSQALAFAPHTALRADDVYMPITPMFHVHAWGIPYVATMVGVKQVYPGRYLPDALLGLIARERVTFSHCVPTILQMMLRHPDAQTTDLFGWKVIIGGSALPVALAREALDRGVDIIAGYGMSETCPILTLAHLRSHMRGWNVDRRLPYLCRAGRPIPFVQLRIVDEDMKDVPHDGTTPGEIVARAPWLTQGYLHETERSEDLWRGGWLHTGDVGFIDDQGYLKITDRIKDVVKTGGEWVSSLDIEDLILRMPQVAEAAVVGIPDERWGERPVALVVTKKGESLTAEAVCVHLSEFAAKGVISRYAVPKRVEFVDSIPKTSVGKLDKKTIRARLLAKEPS
jgi:fatty-acyl-CoA synthase